MNLHSMVCQFCRDFDSNMAGIWPDSEQVKSYSVYLALRMMVCSGLSLLCCKGYAGNMVQVK